MTNAVSMITLGRIAPSREGLSAGSGAPIGGLIDDVEITGGFSDESNAISGKLNGNGDLSGRINGNGDIRGSIEDDES